MSCWIRKILGVNAVERREVAVHVDQEYRDIDKPTPLASILLQDGFDIRENTVHLRGEIKGLEIAIVVQFKTRDTTIICVAARKPRSYSA